MRIQELLKAKLNFTIASVMGMMKLIRNNPKRALFWILFGIAVIVLSIRLFSGGPAKFNVTGTSPSVSRIEEGILPDPVHIYFNGSVAKLQDIEKRITEGISITPTHPGEWKWVNDRQLTFTTSRQWPAGTKYTVRFEKSMFPRHVRLKAHKYIFNTPKFRATITKSEFYLDPKDPKLKRIVATVKFSHAVDTAEFEKRIKIYKEIAGGLFGMKDKPLGFSVSYNKYMTEAYIQSDLLPVPSEDSELIFEVEKGFGSVSGGENYDEELRAKIIVPGVFSIFMIKNAQLTLVRNERYEPEQVMVLQTTNGLLSSELEKNMSVYLLPVDLPSVQGRQSVKNNNWNDPSIIGPEILELCQKVDIEAIPAEFEYSTIHSFRHHVDVGRYIYIKIKKGTLSYGDYILAREFNIILKVPPFPKELNIMHDGAVLSLSGEKKLSILSRGNQALRFQVARILPGQVNHLVSQSAGQFKSPYFKNWNFNYQNISEKYTEDRLLESVNPSKTQYSSFDLSSYLAKSDGMGLFFFKVQSWDPVRKVPTGMEDSRLVLVTDMGLLVKDCKDGSHDVFVQSIHTGMPMPYIRVDVLGKNGIPIFSRSTDESGHVSFPSLFGYSEEKTPTVYVARKSGDVSFIPYNWGDRRLNLSRFDIGGVETPSNDNLSAFLFSDRGIYRPGEKITVGAIVKSGDWRKGLAGIPLEAVFQDPRGVEVSKSRIQLSSSGFEELTYATEYIQPTGGYQASIYTIKDGRRWNLLGSVSVRVEEFIPDRLRIETSFSAEQKQGWVSPDKLKGKVLLNNLYGTPASNHRIIAGISLSPSFPVFREYRDYIFSDPLQAKRRFSEQLNEQNTDGNGEAEFVLDLERFVEATYRLTFSAEGFELGSGRSVSSESTMLISPRPYLIGYKADGNLDYITKNSRRNAEIIAIGPDLKKIGVESLTARIIEQKYVSTLVLQRDGTYKYQSVLKESPISSKMLSIPDSGYTYPLPTENPGDYVLVIQDSEGAELNRINYSVAGAANFVRNLDKNSELQIKINKTDYNPGEEISLQISAPYTGSGLITIERDKVYAYKWFRTEKTNSIQTIRVPADIEGNAYVNVSFVRSISSPEIYMSPLSYGVASFSVSRRSRTNDVYLDTPEIAKPGEPFHIKYRAEKPGKIVIYAVDEGILQLASYLTPDPLAFFFKKRALEVQTLQILDLILPEYRMIQSISSPGGDEGMMAIGKNINPFKRKRDKAVAFWSGIIDADSTEREVIYHIPDYFNGTLRVMAVAVSENTIGTAERKTIVRGPFVINPNVPAVLAPEDQAEISVAVANNVSGSGKNAKVNVKFSTSEQLQIVGNSEITLSISEGRESNAVFKVKALRKLGAAEIVITANLGEKSSKRSVEISIRPPVPYLTTIQSGYLKSDKVSVSVPRRMYKPYRILEVSVSPVPLVISQGLLTYLDKYPYERTDVIISQALSVLSMSRIPDSGYSKKDAINKVAQVLHLLQARQNSVGAIGYWAANAYTSSFDTVYAAHLMTAARDSGMVIPDQLYLKSITYLRNLASNYSQNSVEDERIKAYAIYILTRNGIVTTNYLNNLREQVEKKRAKTWRQDLSGIYMAASYKILRQENQAYDIINSVRMDKMPEYLSKGLDKLIRSAQLLYILSEHFPEMTREIKAEDLMSLVNPISEGHYNTVSSGYSIMGFASYSMVVGEIEPKELSITEHKHDGKTDKLAYKGRLFPKAEYSADADRIVIKSSMDQGVFYQVTQAGYDTEIPDKEENNLIEVQREYQKDGDVVTKADVGDELEVHIKIRTIAGCGYQDVIIEDLLPGGFELVEGSLGREKASGSMRVVNDEYCDEGEGSDYHEQSRDKALPYYVDGREDRVVISMPAGPDLREYVYKIKATNKGIFIIPSPYAESSSDRTILSRGAAGVFIVK